jgi:hypothetical protein
MQKINYLTAPDESIVSSSVKYGQEVKLNLVAINNALPKSNASLIFKGYIKNKENIRSVTNQRCSYCGDKISTHTSTVEHYRPKGKLTVNKHIFLIENGVWVKHNPQVTLSDYGYCLVGSCYKNMLPACESCNTGQGKHDIYIDGGLVSKPSFGKDTKFAIYTKKIKKDHRSGSLYIKDCLNEKPLLFNPYEDDPKVLFKYKLPCNKVDMLCCSHIPIKVKDKKNRYNRIKATYSINILGLNRGYLCETRYSIFMQIIMFKKNIKKDISNNANLQNFTEHSIFLNKMYNPKVLSLLGFTQLILSPVLSMLWVHIKKNFPNESSLYLNDHSTFLSRLKCIDDFGRAVHNPNYRKRRLNKVLGRI